MRWSDAVSGKLFSYVNLQKRVRSDHPLRVIRDIVNATLGGMSAEFDALYSPFGREFIPPERLFRALLLQVLYSIRSERQLVERIDFDLLFRWFVGLGIDDPVWDATTFTKNRDRLLEGDIATQFLAAVLAQPKVKALLSNEHFSVDGTLLEAWASTKSFRPKDGSGRRRIRAATASRISTVRSAATTRMPRPPIPMPGSTVKGEAKRPSCVSWGTRSWRTATV